MVNVLVNSQGKVLLSGGKPIIASGSGQPATKYGATINSILGNTTSGTLQAATAQEDLNFSGVLDLTRNVMVFRFANTGVKSVAMNDLTTITGDNALNSAFQDCHNLQSASFSSLETIENSYVFNNAFKNCTALISVNLSALEEVHGDSAMNSAFYGCTALTTMDLSSLTIVEDSNSMGGIFSGCTSLTTLNVDSLEEIKGGSAFYKAFMDCTSLRTVDFKSIKKLTGNACLHYAFQNSGIKTLYFRELNNVSFGAYTNQLNQMLNGCSNVTVHFPENLEATIGNWTDVQNGFGGTNVTVLFDLDPTEDSQEGIPAIVGTLTGNDASGYTGWSPENYIIAPYQFNANEDWTFEIQIECHDWVSVAPDCASVEHIWSICSWGNGNDGIFGSTGGGHLKPGIAVGYGAGWLGTTFAISQWNNVYYQPKMILTHSAANQTITAQWELTDGQSGSWNPISDSQWTICGNRLTIGVGAGEQLPSGVKIKNVKFNGVLWTPSTWTIN